MKILILLLFLIISILIDAYLIKRGKHISHGWNAFKTIFVGLLVLGWNEPSNQKVFSNMFIYLSSCWILIDLGLNLKRGFPWDYIGNSARLDKFLRKVKINQFVIKVGVLLTSLLVYTLLRDNF
jgi:hypothetical protein